MVSNSTFRFGVIGCGSIAGQFVQAVQFLPGMCVASAAARDKERARRFAVRHGIETYYGDYGEMLQSGNIDAVYIATVNTHHLAPMLLALELGIPVLCEKPLALTTADFDLAAAAAKKHGVLLMEAMWSCFLPSYQAIRTLLQDGRLGRVASAYLHFCVPFPKNPSSRIYSPALGGGLIYDIGVYNLHTALYLFGDDLQDLSICGQTGPTGVDVSSVISFSYRGGPTVCTTTSDVAGPHELIVCGEQGLIRAEHYNGAQELCITLDGREERLCFPFDCNGFEYEIQEFVRCVQTGCTESDTVGLLRSRHVCELMETAVRTICGGSSSTVI